MIVLYPVLLIGALALAVKRDRAGGRGWLWFGWWSVAGTLFSFSFLTGLSIGLLVLPFATAALLAAAGLAPHRAESSGFVAGTGATSLVVAAANWGDAHPGAEPMPWLFAGLALVTASAAGYAIRSHR